MFSDLICHPDHASAREAVVTVAGSASWAELAELARGFAQQFRRLAGRRVGLSFRPVAASFSTLAALDELQADVFLLDGDSTPDAMRSIAERFRLGALVVPATASTVDVMTLENAANGSGVSSVTILTSGTTGAPKAATHTWDSLSRPARVASDQTGSRWMLSYRPNLYAGLQVILQCWVNHGTLLIPEATASSEAVVKFMRDARAEYSSATPSYWRRLLLFTSPALLRQVELKQITLGGELVDQQILDMLHARFPEARVVHIYATTELGRCFSVTDGHAGFPAAYLRRPSPDGIELREVDGELMVRSANAMKHYDSHSGLRWTTDAWIRTGDLIEVIGERVYFTGRRSDLINVGGNKVHPVEVERAIRALPGVADVVVYKTRSSLAGELVACDVVPAHGQDPQALRKALGAHCAAELAPYQRPRSVQMVDGISLSRTGKKVRRAP
jgi:acyl-CoA synthetase (AMP-forming)/AMP-acid ligase II